MGNRDFQLTLAADEAGELVTLLRKHRSCGEDIEVAERLRGRLLEADHEFKMFLYRFKAGSDAQPHKHLMRQERELWSMGLLQGHKSKDDTVFIGVVQEEETLLVG